MMTPAQIERVIDRSLIDPNIVSARFEVIMDDGRGDWFCCEAFLNGGTPVIQCRSLLMTLEEAAVVAIAITMAVQWIGEESTK